MTTSPPPTVDVTTRVREHSFTAGLDDEHSAAIAEHARAVEVTAGSFVLEHDKPARTTYLLLDGDVALEIERPGRLPLVIETLHADDTLGWSWLFEPRRWQLDAHAMSDVTAVEIDAEGLRALMDDDPAFAAVLTRRVAALAVDRLQHARIQLALVDS